LELSLIVVLGATLSYLFSKFRQPLIIGYILTGFIIGPSIFALLASENGKAIDNYVVVPLFYQTENAVSYRTDLLPLGFKIAGSIHSHPSGSNRPSNADLHSFVKQGACHFIVGQPFTLESLACYDYNGNPLSIVII